MIVLVWRAHEGQPIVLPTVSYGRICYMHPIDAALANVPLLLNDFFRHLHSGTKPKVFLCGKEPEERHIDLRFQVKRLLANRMGCHGFLGEEIEEFRQTQTDSDHLTIEVREAVRSDLILMFLGSPGTIAELTAFVLNPKTNPKILVFNDKEHRGRKSFINAGPLKLLGSDRVVFYDPHEVVPDRNVITQIDRFLAKEWYRRSRVCERAIERDLTFESMMTMLMIYALFPVRNRDLEDYAQFKGKSLNQALTTLFDRGLIRKEEKKYLPSVEISEWNLPGGAIADIGRARAMAFDKRLAEEEVLSDYRLIL